MPSELSFLLLSAHMGSRGRDFISNFFLMDSVFTDSIYPWIEAGFMVLDIWGLISDYVALTPCGECGVFISATESHFPCVKKDSGALYGGCPGKWTSLRVCGGPDS